MSVAYRYKTTTKHDRTTDSRKAHSTAQPFAADSDYYYGEVFLVVADLSYLPAFIDFHDHLAIFQVIVKRPLFSVG